jgi:GntR family transcriptional regulator
VTSASGPPRRQTLGGSPLYQQAAQELARILANTAPNTFLPSEPELARQLGISRATLREAMRSFEEQGLIVRRQGVGTIVTRPPRTLDAGLEVLESLETLAARTGLSVEMGELRVEERKPTVDEAGLLELSGDVPVVELARVILTGGRPVAYLIDVAPRHVLPDEALAHGFRGSVLDLLLRKGDPELDVSRTEIGAVSATADVARALRIQRGDVLLRLEAYLYTRAGTAIDHSWSYFLPGSIRLHVVRRVGKHARPDEGGGAGTSGHRPS